MNRQDVFESVLGSVSSTKQENKFKTTSYNEEVMDESLNGNPSDCDENQNAFIVD